MKWFSPLVSFDEYHTSSSQAPSNEHGYVFEEIVDIVSPKFDNFF